MSDVAVTWAKAQSCLTKTGRPDRNAKQVLVHMASYADAAGEAWALVSVLALEMDCEERTVERGRKALVDAGLLVKTDQSRLHNGKRIPIYRLPLDEGHASTVRRIKAERAAVGELGATRVTPLGATRVTPQDARGDTGDTPRGDTGDTQIGKGNSLGGLPPSSGVREREAAKRLWATRAPERVSDGPVNASWASALERSGVEPERLLAAVKAAVARDPDFARGKAVGLVRWLDEGRFVGWLPEDGAMPVAAPSSGWVGPGEVRDAVAEAMGAAAVASYLNPATWDDAARAVVAATRMAADRLRDGAGRRLEAMGVRVRFGGAAHG